MYRYRTMRGVAVPYGRTGKRYSGYGKSSDNNSCSHAVYHILLHAASFGWSSISRTKASKNLAFIGNFAETPRDTVFTTEYSVRTAMEAVYTLLDIDRGVPEVFASAFDVRLMMNAMYYLNDQKKLTELDLPLSQKLLVKEGLKKVKGTYIEELLKEYRLI